MSQGGSRVSHIHTSKLQKDQSRYSQQLSNSLLIEEAVHRLLLEIMRKNDRKWREVLMGYSGMGTRRVVSENEWGRENVGGRRDGGLLKARACCSRQNGRRPLCDAFDVAARSTWLSVSSSEDDGMFRKRTSTPAELIHSLWFTTATPRGLNASLFTLRGYAFPTWCNHTNQHFFL